MPNATEIADRLVTETGLEPGTVRTIIRRLGDARLIPRASRGKGAASLNEVEVARVLVATMVAADHFAGTAAHIIDLVPVIERLTRGAFALLVADIDGRGDGEYVVRFCGEHVGLYRVAPGETVEDAGNGCGLIREYRATRRVIEALRGLFNNALAA